MIEAPAYPMETERLATLRSLQLLDTPIQLRFERITRMVCRLLEVPIAHFNLLDEDRQHLKSVQGLNAVDAPLEGAFCTHAIFEDSMLVVCDASKDPRFFDNPFVTGRFLKIGFYAGCPVRAPNGLPIGTLCAIDTRPRRMSAERLSTLRDLADMIETELRVSSLSNAHAELIGQLDAAQRLARIDPLTRLWNRTGIFELLQKEWAEADRHQTIVTVAIADIDHFKKINDDFGHPIGDAVIANTAKALLGATRGEDAVGRLGGEEFLIILTGCKPDGHSDAVERMREAVQSHDYSIEGNALSITASFGAAATIPHPGITPDQLLKNADDALYRAKRSGRNCCQIHECCGTTQPGSEARHVMVSK